MPWKFLNKIFSEKKKKAARHKKAEGGALPEESEKEVLGREKEGRAGKAPILTGILERAHITEKSSGGSKENKYVFLVGQGANGVLIKKAVEGKYGVIVRAVNILNMPGKERKRGKQVGWRPGYKKAVVTLTEGQSIEIQ